MPFTQESINKLMQRANMCDVCGKHEKVLIRDNLGLCVDCSSKHMARMYASPYPYATKKYGIPEMSILEEMNLPASQRQTISNKITMIDKCGLLQQALDQIKSRAKAIPVIDDEEHATGVQEMTDQFLQAYDLLWEVALHGIH